jgi:hypothetical protein
MGRKLRSAAGAGNLAHRSTRIFTRPWPAGRIGSAPQRKFQVPGAAVESSRSKVHACSSALQPRAFASQSKAPDLCASGLLLHAEFDRLDRIGRVHGIVLRLIGVDQGRQNIETIALKRLRFGSPQLLDLGERGFVVLVGTDGPGLMSFLIPHLYHIDRIIVAMRSDPFDPDDALLEIDGHHQSTAATLDVEYNQVCRNDACRCIQPFHVGRTSPSYLTYLIEPCVERSFQGTLILVPGMRSPRSPVGSAAQ